MTGVPRRSCSRPRTPRCTRPSVAVAAASNDMAHAVSKDPPSRWSRRSPARASSPEPALPFGGGPLLVESLAVRRVEELDLLDRHEQLHDVTGADAMLGPDHCHEVVPADAHMEQLLVAEELNHVARRADVRTRTRCGPADDLEVLGPHAGGHLDGTAAGDALQAVGDR